ncbi:MAG TPA: ferredoxin [Afipia sp.]
MAESIKRKLEVDLDRCQGHARCFALAPELFGTDEYGNGEPRSGGLVMPEDFEKARLAQRSCPEFAIRIKAWED